MELTKEFIKAARKENLSDYDIIASLTYFTAETMAKAIQFTTDENEPIKVYNTIETILYDRSVFRNQIIVKITLSHISGGGLHNPTLFKMLSEKCQEINRQVEFKEVYDYSSV